MTKQGPGALTKTAKGLTPEIIDAHPGWHGMAPLIEKCFDTVMSAEVKGVRPGVVAVLLTDDAQMIALNTAHRAKAAPTNVLSFPADPAFLQLNQTDPLAGESSAEGVFWGDLALSYDTCLREAQLRGISLFAHAAHLVIHGLLHLFGYDHQTDRDATEMEAVESKLLARLGIADPHGDPF